MNALLGELRRSLEELQLGLDGALNMSPAMEALLAALAAGRVPQSWMACMSNRIQVGPGLGILLNLNIWAGGLSTDGRWWEPLNAELERKATCFCIIRLAKENNWSGRP
jgi:hypothetical protein